MSSGPKIGSEPVDSPDMPPRPDFPPEPEEPDEPRLRDRIRQKFSGILSKMKG